MQKCPSESQVHEHSTKTSHHVTESLNNFENDIWEMKMCIFVDEREKYLAVLIFYNKLNTSMNG